MALEILLRLLLLLNIILFHHHGCEAEEVVVNMDGTVATGGPLPMPYGVDVSWPMQNPELFLEKTPLSEQQIAYESYMVGCYGAYEEEICNDSEQERIEMTFHQPPYQKNFTSAGYAKIKAPQKVFALLQKIWKTKQDCRTKETWNKGNIYVNHWDSPTEIIDLNDPCVGFTSTDRKMLGEEVQAVLEKWSRVPLIPTSLYGIRIYNHGSILAPHVDRMPLVTSAIINVAQENTHEGTLGNDWVAEFIGHNGLAVNVTMQPGEMILYESHSVIHGRPFPFEGNAYANVFLHFEPVGYSAQQKKRIHREMRSAKDLYEQTLVLHQEEAVAPRSIPRQRHREALEPTSDLPSYIEEGTQAAMQWRQDYIFLREEIKERKVISKSKTRTSGVTSAHLIAARGDLKQLKEVVEKNPDFLHKKDSNGWKPLHEAARGGRTEVIKYILQQKGVDVNERTNNGHGGSALWWAQKELSDADHPTIVLLKKYGGVPIAPGKPGEKKK